MKIARLGVWLDRDTRELRQQYGVNVFESYASEILAYAGFTTEEFHQADQMARERYDVVIAALPGEKPEDLDALWTYMQDGGTVVSFGGLQGLAPRLGCSADRSREVGYASVEAPWSAEVPMRCFGLKPWQAAEPLDAWGELRMDSPDGAVCGSVLQSFAVGQGRLDRWGFDLSGTVVKLQQGLQPVVTDGRPAPSGDGELTDHLLKADDECALDWDLDRKTTETGMNYYAHPYADYWQQALAGRLLQLASELGLVLPFVDFWPEGVEQVAMISHDSDSNVDESAEITLQVLKECEVQSTWCMIEPGYSKHLYEQIKKDGHELAFHYNALPKDDGFWDKEEFGRQFDWLKEAIGQVDVTSNKNHYTLYHGWSELFDWCEAYGIACDQTRGPSKKGNVGFLFGTCHPYQPISWVDQRNRIYDVVELHFLTQDLNHETLADTSVLSPFLQGVKRVRGVAHFLFHQIHLLRQPAVREALKLVAAEAKREGFAFWTGGQINDWYRAKRSIRITGIDDQGKVSVQAAAPVEQAVVWIPMLPGTKADAEETATRYGMPCRKQVLTMQGSEGIPVER